MGLDWRHDKPDGPVYDPLSRTFANMERYFTVTPYDDRGVIARNGLLRELRAFASLFELNPPVMNEEWLERVKLAARRLEEAYRAREPETGRWFSSMENKFIGWDSLVRRFERLARNTTEVHRFAQLALVKLVAKELWEHLPSHTNADRHFKEVFQRRDRFYSEPTQLNFFFLIGAMEAKFEETKTPKWGRAQELAAEEFKKRLLAAQAAALLHFD